MPSFLRKVQYKTNWDPGGEFSTYLPSWEAPADALGDLRTSNNELSFWEIDDLAANLERILAAIASRGEHLQKIDYIIVDSKQIQQLGVKIEKNDGETHDSHANTNWHYNLTQLSASDLSRLANCLFKHGKSGRKNDASLVPLLKTSIANGFVDKSKLLPNLVARLSKN